MASSSLPYIPSPLARDQGNDNSMTASSSSCATSDMSGFPNNAQPVYLQADGTTIPSLPFGDPAASSSRLRLQQPFQQYGGSNGANSSILFNFHNNNNNSNNNNYYASLPGVGPLSFTGSVPFIPPPPATGPCPLAQPVDIDSLGPPGLDATGNETSVTASPTSPTAASAQPMYNYYSNGGPSGYVTLQPQQPSKHVDVNNNSGWATDASDWEDHHNGPRMSLQQPPTYGIPKQVLSTWAPQPSLHFATPSSSTGSPASPPNHLKHLSPVTQVAHSEPKQEAPAVPVKVPRPPNAWILYRSDMLNQIRNGTVPPGLEEIARAQQPAQSTSATSGSEGDNKKKGKKGCKDNSSADLLAELGGGKAGRGLPQADISKMISLLWKKETEEGRRKYEQMAELKKLEHQKQYPNYKFQPVRKEEKQALRLEKQAQREAGRRDKELQRSRARRRLRGRPSPSHDDEGHIVGNSLTRSNSYPGPEEQAPFMSYGAWPQANVTAEDSEGEFQTSLAQPVLLDASMLSMPVQIPSQFSYQVGPGAQQQFAMPLPTDMEMPPSPQRSSGPPTLSSSYPDATEWAAPHPAAQMNQRTIITPPQDDPGQGHQLQMPLDSKKDQYSQAQALYVFQPPNIPPGVQVTDPEVLAAVWCHMDPDQLDSILHPSPANPTPTYAFPTPPMAQSIDTAAWDQHELDNNSIQFPVSVASMIMADWNQHNSSGSGMMLTPNINGQQHQQQQQQQAPSDQTNSNTNFQRTLAPTPSFSPIDGSNFNQQESPMRPSAWGFMNASPNGFPQYMNSSNARTMVTPYPAQLMADRDSAMFGGRFTNELDGSFINTGQNGDMSKDIMMPQDMSGPSNTYAPAMGANVGLPFSNVAGGPASRMARRSRQVASKYETVAGGV